MNPEKTKQPERYIKNPVQLFRAIGEFALMPLVAVDNNLYTEELYPPIGNVEAPAATEADLY